MQAIVDWFTHFNWALASLLFAVGVGEEIIYILYIKMATKSRKFACAVFQFFRSCIWFGITLYVAKYLEGSLIYFLFYAFGCSVGDYYGLAIEPFLDKFFNVKRRGRRKKWNLWWKRLWEVKQ